MTKSDFNKNIVITIIFVVCIFFLWKSDVIYSHSLFPIVKEGRLHIFADWAWVIKNGICKNLGFDIFKSYDSCPLYGKDNFIFNIGNILLYIPYYKLLEKNKAISFIEKNFTWKLISKKLSDLFIND